MFDFTGKTALITGSSRGIGRAILLELARHGATVILHCRKECASAEETIATCRSDGGRCFAVYGDLSEKNAPADIMRQVSELGLSVDILVLNASVEIRREWTEIDDKDYDVQMDTNFRAPFKLAQLFVPPMQERRWGRVVTIGSTQQIKPHEAMMIYAAAKCALKSMMLNLAVQLAKDGITVNNIAPGAVRTDRNIEALSDPKYEKKVEDLIPMHYIGRPGDIAALAVLVCSEESKYMTGQDIYVDGGKSL